MARREKARGKKASEKRRQKESAGCRFVN